MPVTIGVDPQGFPYRRGAAVPERRLSDAVYRCLIVDQQHNTAGTFVREGWFSLYAALLV